MKKNKKIKVQDVEINITTIEEEDYISLTDMANAKEDEVRAADIIKNRNGQNGNTNDFNSI